MRAQLKLLSLCIVVACVVFSNAQAATTKRIAQFSNERVNVWQTIIYPSSKQVLTMHRHDYDRVVVALSDGLLKVTNNKGVVHYLKLEKNKSYYLTRDVPKELHTDENMSHHPVKVVVIELKG